MRIITKLQLSFLFFLGATRSTPVPGGLHAPRRPGSVRAPRAPPRRPRTETAAPRGARPPAPCPQRARRALLRLLRGALLRLQRCALPRLLHGAPLLLLRGALLLLHVAIGAPLLLLPLLLSPLLRARHVGQREGDDLALLRAREHVAGGAPQREAAELVVVDRGGVNGVGGNGDGSVDPSADPWFW